MDCKNCEAKQELKNCFDALKQANELISSLKCEQWEMKKKLEKEIRCLVMRENKKAGFSQDYFYTNLKKHSETVIYNKDDEIKKIIFEASEKWQGKRVLFIIPLGMVNGGGNVIMNEAAAMRRFGVDAVIMNLKSMQEQFINNYGDMNVPALFVDDFAQVREIAADYDVVCATAWQTVYASEMNEVNKLTTVAYYIQDYEPNFYADSSSMEYRYAKESYSYIPEMVCMTKTNWNANEIERNTGKKCHVLCPSFRGDNFAPKRKEADNKVIVTAMVRPQSMLRSPELTMEILSEIYKKYGNSVEIHIFGNEENSDADFFIHAETNFEYVNHELTSPEKTSKILGEADIFVDFSRYQAMGLTALEAMASGCAVIVPKDGGTTEFAKNEINCIVVDTSDRDACIEELCKLIENSELRERIAYRAVEDARDYYPERSAVLFLENVFRDDKNTVKCEKDSINQIAFDKIKLIIWDMDDTFWKGTLSEGNVTCPEENVLLIKLLSMDGIINSISSKNDLQPVIDKLEQIESGLSSYFVFNSINWEEKGIQITAKLNDMRLRAVNTLFIDDNPRNLQEVSATNDGIMVSGPEIIPELIEYITGRIKKNGVASDPEKNRLEQYRLMESKKTVAEGYSTNEAFLRDSEIKVEFGFDCWNNIDRIVELIQRTNQLNYTKNRSSKEEIIKLINSDWNRSAYIMVRDKFGDYGLVGFYCYNKLEKKMEHFLFSCRILGMGVEQYVYNRMECPDINIIEPVAVVLKKDKFVDWISEDTDKTMLLQKVNCRSNLKRILLKGPCDLSAIEQYLIGGSITSEFNFVNNRGFITTGQNHSVHIFEGNVLSEDEIKIVLRDAPFLIKEDFETLLFSKEYNVVCYSMLSDCHAGLYRHRETGLYVSFGSVNFDLTDEKNWGGYISGKLPNHFFHFTEEILREFKEKWCFEGTTPDDVLLYNLEYMYENIPGRPTIVLLLGSEIEYQGENEEFANHAGRHRHINQLIKEFAADKCRIKLINMTDYVYSQADYEDSINHFRRRVYYDIATEVVKYINESN